MMLLNNNILLRRPDPEPPDPPSFDVLAFNLTGTSSGLMSSRQTGLEPSVAGADRPWSWSIWFRASNVGVAAEYVFSNNVTGTGANQYACVLRSATESGSINQHLQFSLLNGANFIQRISSMRILKNRWYHLVVTYDGSETASGINLYFNGVLDASATTNSGGTYTGALNDAALRTQLSRVIATQHFKGNMRAFSIWNKELNQTKITELFNSGTPISVPTVSFYAADVAAHWPLETDLVCSNNVAFNFSNTDIAFVNRPLSPYFEGLTIFNALPGNTRYIAFGTALPYPSASHIWLGDGTSHVVDTYINKVTFNYTDLLAASPATFSGDVLNALPNGLRGGQVGRVNGNIVLFTSKYDDVGLAFVDFGKYVSTDGETGEAFGAFESYETPAVGESINAYGNCIAGDAAGEFFQGYHEYTVASQTISVWHTTDNWATKNKIVLFTGDSTNGYNELCILRVGPGSYVGLVRQQAGAQISCFVTTDSFATVSTPVNSTLATGTGMAAMCLNPDGQIVAIYADRGDGFLKISNKNNVADILADPSDWNAGSSIWQTIDGTANLLGYPTIVANGWYYAISVSSEFSSSRSDLFVGYGLLGQ